MASPRRPVLLWSCSPGSRGTCSLSRSARRIAAGHQFWHLHDPADRRHDPEAPIHLKNAMQSVYRAIDDAIGALLRACGRETVVLVVASHGMGPNIGGPQLLPEFLIRLGLGPGRAAAETTAQNELHVAQGAGAWHVHDIANTSAAAWREETIDRLAPRAVCAQLLRVSRSIWTTRRSKRQACSTTDAAPSV